MAHARPEARRPALEPGHGLAVLPRRGRRVDRLGYDHLWTWDHLYAIFGDPYQPIFEGWIDPGRRWAMATERVRLGLLVGANTFRNPGSSPRLATTLDHISGGRAILGLGGAWFELEHDGPRHRLRDGLRPAARLARRGGRRHARGCSTAETVTSAPGGHYAFDDLRHAPRPVQPHLPIMIGGSGEKKTLRTVATYADMWNAMGPLDAHAPTRSRCSRSTARRSGATRREIEFTLGVQGRPSATRRPRRERVWKAAMEHNRTPMADVADDDTFWNGTPEQLAERLAAVRASSASGPRSRSSRRPYDTETLERLIGAGEAARSTALTRRTPGGSGGPTEIA